MKKSLWIHLGICLIFAVIWIIFIICNSKGLIVINETLFASIAFVLSGSYLIHHVVAEKKK